MRESLIYTMQAQAEGVGNQYSSHHGGPNIAIGRITDHLDNWVNFLATRGPRKDLHCKTARDRQDESQRTIDSGNQTMAQGRVREASRISSDMCTAESAPSRAHMGVRRPITSSGVARG